MKDLGNANSYGYSDSAGPILHQITELRKEHSEATEVCNNITDSYRTHTTAASLGIRCFQVFRDSTLTFLLKELGLTDISCKLTLKQI